MKRCLIGALLLWAASVANAQATYTLADVAKHKTASDCWMVLNSTDVYDLTNFLSLHPAGSGIMVSHCGTDATQAFNAIGHSANAVAMEAKYLIGTLGSGTPPPAVVGVTIAPANATITVGKTQQFTPTVTNSGAGVSWTVSPGSLGSISASGLFTATGAGQGTVTATSMQDTTKSATAVVTVTANTPPPPQAITVSVSPSALSLNTGRSVQFTAAVTNSTQGVSWSVTGGIGKISANGRFTAGSTPGTGSVVATSVQDPTKSQAVEVTVTTVQCAQPPARPRHDDGDHGHHDD